MSLYGSDTTSTQITQQQQAQQAAVSQGQADISSIFGGGQGVNPISNTNPGAPGAPIYDQYGAVVVDPSAYAPGTTFYTGATSSGGFNQAFYNQRQQDYENYAIPQFQQQYQNTLAQTTYDLARSGLSTSSAANTLDRALNTEKTNQLQDISNTGLQQSQQLQSNVAQEQNTLLGQLETSADPQQAATQALAAASQFSQPTAWPALGSLFSNFTNTYLTKNLAQNYAQVGQPGYFPTPVGTSPAVGASLGAAGSIM